MGGAITGLSGAAHRTDLRSITASHGPQWAGGSRRVRALRGVRSGQGVVHGNGWLGGTSHCVVPGDVVVHAHFEQLRHDRRAIHAEPCEVVSAYPGKTGAVEFLCAPDAEPGERWSGCRDRGRCCGVSALRIRSDCITIPHRDGAPGMPQCANCSSFVSDQYVRVFAPADRDTVRVCPNCDDMVRTGGDVRPAHTLR